VSVQFREPWVPIEESKGKPFVEELQREMSPEHPLFGQRVEAVGRRRDNDDVLFRFGASLEDCAIVHLTWTGKRETSGLWPSTKIFDSVEKFLAEDTDYQ
jgi:hypothetical protein